MARAHREQNRKSWNEATRAHNSHKGDQAAFLKKKRSTTLFPEELELLGPLQGRALLHLQCNAGQDTLSLAKRGARATGVDQSDEAIAFAQRLSRDSGIPASFVRSDVYDYLAKTRARFDLVFCSYGVVGWLDDLKAWARGIARVLRLQKGTQGFVNPHPAVEFPWSLAETVQALLDAKLVLERLDEFPYANGCALFTGMRAEGRRLFPAQGQPQVPMMFGVRARRA